MNRRQFIATTSATVASAGCTSLKQHPEKQIPIVDTHQHLWNLDRFKLNWLDEAPAVLKRSFGLNDYLAATKGLNIAKAIYLDRKSTRLNPSHKPISYAVFCLQKKKK